MTNRMDPRILVLAYLTAASAMGESVLQIDADQVIGRVSPAFSGMMTEEINHSYDGGLYAELIRNRAFKDDASQPVHWSLVQEQGSEAGMKLDPATPLNDKLDVSLRLDVRRASSVARAGVANDGFWGIAIRPHTKYRASFYARPGAGFAGPLVLSLESADGSHVFAQGRIKRLSPGWKKYSAVLATDRNVLPTADARFVLSVETPGTIWFDLISLFPPTWKNRPNGNRIDIMRLLAGMKPGFLRFPGGNYLEGSTVATRFPWKDTLGPLDERPGHPGCWGYRSSDGMGLLEFLEWAEDLESEPILAVYAGFSLPPKRELIKSGPDLAPYVQDALDEIEYVAGDSKSKWGRRRAADGHPKPFPLHYVEIGNEDWFDDSGSYDGRFAQFYDAIKAKYPKLQIISTVGNEQPAWKRVHSRKPDVLDEHYYFSEENGERDAASRFEQYDRNGPKIFVGEWACYGTVEPWKAPHTDHPPDPSWDAALGDAAWITAMERNCDLVAMQCYAPLFVNVNRDAWQWWPDLIEYNALWAWQTPSYHVIAMLNTNRGDVAVHTVLHRRSAQKFSTFYSVTKDSRDGTIYIHIVNAGDFACALQFRIDGVKKIFSRGTYVHLGYGHQGPEAPSDSDGPVTGKLDGLGFGFTKSFGSGTVTVLKVRTAH